MLLFGPFSPTRTPVLFGVILSGSNIKPLYVMEMKPVRLITVSNFDAHTSRLFDKVNFYQLRDDINLQTLYFVNQFVARELPKIFDS